MLKGVVRAAIGAAFALCLCVAGAASADDSPSWIDEIVFGVGHHDVGVFGRQKEDGFDTNAEIRFPPFTGDFWTFILSPRPHIGLHLNTAGDTSQLFGGFTWMFELGWNVFAGGSAGLAVHNGERRTTRLDRKELGLPVLFRESLELGYRLTERHAVSVMLDHISNSDIHENNEGLDTFGVRYAVGL